MNLLPNASIGHPRLRLRLAFALLALLAAAGILGLGVNVFTNERRTAIDKANDANLTAARLLAEHGFQLIRTCDVLLVHMIDAVSTTNGPVLPAQHALMLRSLVSRFTEVSFLLLIDGEGNLRWSSALEQVTPINYADRSYFKRHVAGEDLVIGEPIISRSTGKSILPVTRAIRDDKGKLTGVVLAAIETRYIDHVFNSARLANSDAVALFMADGTLVARQPPVGVGQRFLSAVSIDRVTREPSGAYATVSPVDGTPRLVAYAQIATYGLVVVVSQTTANVFASARLLGLRFILVGLTGLFIVFILTRFALDALKGEETALASLHIANERLSTVVAAVPEGIFGLHEDGRITFANEAALAIIGYQAADVVGADVQLLLQNPQDESESAVDCPLKQSVQSGAHGTADAQFWRKDGSSLPVEYVVGPMALAGGGRGCRGDLPRHQRTQAHARADPPTRLFRYADQSAQSPHVGGPAGLCAGPGQAASSLDGGDVPRSRQVQGNQRHPWPRLRR